MISKMELYLNNEWQDVTSYLQRNDIVIQDRCDEAFATGTLQLRYSRNTNIPPYTPCRLNNNEYWFAKSICRRYLTKKNYYIHNVELLELTAILSCFILGSKNFSVTGTNKKDYDKINIINWLMQEKYGAAFIFEELHILNKEQEFTFGPGTTVFDAFTEIAKSYDGVKIKVVDYDPIINTYRVQFKLNDTLIELCENRIIDEYYVQDTDSYGAILESEMTNVVDRTNTIKISNITLRSDDFHMTADNSTLILPTRCEKVVDFGISSASANLYCQFAFGEEYCKVLDALGYYPSNAVRDGKYYKTFSEWISILKVNGYSPLQNVLDNIFISRFKLDKNLILKSTWELSYYGSQIGDSKYLYLSGYNEASGHKGEIMGLPVIWSLKEKILPKDKWLLLEDAEKPKYVYYESGSNRIEGMNNYYKNDFWNKVLGNTVKPFLYYSNKEDRVEFDLEDAFNEQKRTHVTAKYYCDYSRDYEEIYTSLYHSFWIEYYPITDPFINHIKNINPNNENNVKLFSRSYNKTSNYIDFDRLMKSLQLSNNMRGLPEGTIEYRLGPNETTPKAFQRIIRNGKEWTIASVVLTSSLSKESVVINLVYDYNKIADAIGVKTQYNETKNPLNNIIDRAVFWEKDASAAVPGICNECWAKLQIAGKTLYKRVAVLENENTVYIYFEALDQYCFDKQAVPVGNTSLSENYYCNDIAYCDSNNEALGASISLGIIPALSREDSLDLPIYHGGDFVELIDLGYRLLYKDARERLLFTLRLNNCKVVPITSLSFVKLRVIVDEGVREWKATRIQSYIGETGELKQNDFCFTGDIINVIAYAKDGYGVVGGALISATVGELDLRMDRYLDFNFRTEKKVVGLAPLVNAEISKDSSGWFDYFQYTIENPNDVAVSATVNFYLKNGERYDSIIHELEANVSHLNGFETQRDITTIEVIFHSSLFSNSPRTQCQVYRK